MEPKDINITGFNINQIKSDAKFIVDLLKGIGNSAEAEAARINTAYKNAFEKVPKFGISAQSEINKSFSDIAGGGIKKIDFSKYELNNAGLPAATAKNSTDDKAKQEKESFDKMLNDYISYEEKRCKVAEEYDKKWESIFKNDDSGAPKQKHLEEVDRSKAKALEEVDKEFALREYTFQAWMEEIATYSLEQLKVVLQNAEQELKFFEETGEGNDQQLAEARAKVKEAKDKVGKAEAKINLAPGKQARKEWEELQKSLQTVEKEFKNIGDAVGGTVGKIMNTAGTIMSSTLNMINSIIQLSTMSTTAITTTAQASSKAMQTVEKASVILAIISAAMQIAMKIASLFNNDESYQKEIKKLQGRIEQLQWELNNKDAIRVQSNSFQALEKVKEIYAEVSQEVLRLHGLNDNYLNSFFGMLARAVFKNEILQKSAQQLAIAYANIGYTADKALGEEKFKGAKNDLENIAQQQLLTQEKINAEKSKKKSDKEAIAKMEREIQELGEKANSIINNIVEGIIGGSAEAIATQLGDAFFEAFKSGEDAAEAWSKKVNDIVANILRRMLISKFLEEPLGEVFDKYKSKWYKDGEFAGIDAVTGSMTEFSKDLNNVGTGFMKMWKTVPEDVLKFLPSAEIDASREVSSKGFAAMSQDSAEELNGRFTIFTTLTYEINENTKILVANSGQMLLRLAGIEGNTAACRRLDGMDADLKSIRYTLSDIQLKGLKVI